MAMDRKRLQDYLDGLLPEEEAAEVQRLLTDHWDDPEVVALMDAHFDACRVEPSGDDRKMLSAVHGRMAGGRTVIRRRTGLWMAAAAALALLLAVPAAFQWGYRMHREPSAALWQELSVPATETRSIDLPDGTHLVLNAGSRITWPDRFAGDTREVFLEGEVLAQVAKDPQHPFIIHAGDVKVRVYGTTFDFKSFRDQTQVQLMLLDGAVSLNVPSEEGMREVSLTPGDIALYDRDAGNVSLSKMSAETFRPFTEGRSFSFFNAPLRDIVAELERSFGRRIVIGDGRIRDSRYLAFFTNGESLEEILRLLSNNGNLRISYTEDGIYLYSKK